MQVEIKLSCESPAFLPFSYHAKLSAALYHALGEADSGFAADVHSGTTHSSRIKMFAFSPLNSHDIKMQRGHNGENPGIIFNRKASFRVASPWPELMNKLGEGLLKRGELRIGSQFFRVDTADVIAPPEFTSEMKWAPVSPSSIVTSWSDPGERKAYLIPSANGGNDDEISPGSVLRGNVIHKWQRLCELRPDIAARWVEMKNPDEGMSELFGAEHVQVEIDAEAVKQKMHYVKGTPVKSWISLFHVTAPVALQKLLYYSGAGQMNSMGFGVVEEAGR